MVLIHGDLALTTISDRGTSAQPLVITSGAISVVAEDYGIYSGIEREKLVTAAKGLKAQYPVLHIAITVNYKR
jgi:hypothetical protein